MMNLRRRKIIAFLLFIPDCYSSLGVAKEVSQLPVPDEFHAVMTVERELYGVSPSENGMFLFPGKSQYMVKMPLDMKAKERETKFGKLTDQTKILLQDAAYPGDWRGAFQSVDRIIVWDGSLLQLLVLRAKDFKTIQSATVPTDTLKPPADRMGEPTIREVAVTRKHFRDNSRKIFGTKFTGMAEMPANWGKGKDREFLVSSHVADFPVLIMSCLKDDPATCKIARHCFLEGGPKRAADAVTGIGVVPGSRMFMIGDNARNEIDIYKFNSCFDVQWIKTLKLPSRVPKMSNLHVDSEGRLWIVSVIAESFTDSNLFYWERDVWNSVK